MTDYSEYAVTPEQFEFRAATTEESEALMMINDRNRAAGITGMIIFFGGGIFAIIFGYTMFGLAGAIAATVIGVIMIFVLALSIRTRTKLYTDFRITRCVIVDRYKARSGGYSCDLWSEEQHKYAKGIHALDRNGVREGAEVYLIKATHSNGDDYIVVTDYDFKVMKMNSEARAG